MKQLGKSPYARSFVDRDIKDYRSGHTLSRTVNGRKRIFVSLKESEPRSVAGRSPQHWRIPP